MQGQRGGSNLHKKIILTLAIKVKLQLARGSKYNSGDMELKRKRFKKPEESFCFGKEKGFKGRDS